MQILDCRPSQRIALALHASFISLYLLLIARLAVSLYEGPSNFLQPSDDWMVTLIIKRMAGVVYHPFFAVLLGPSIEGNAHLIVTIAFALLSYGMIHYAIFMNIGAEGSSFVADRILKLCRALFFLGGTLLLLLIIARMGVMLYQDVAFGRLRFGIRAPASK